MSRAAGLVRLFQELREASVVYGFKHFQISLDNPIYAGQPQLAVAYNLSGIAEHIDFFMRESLHSATPSVPLSQLWPLLYQ